MSALARQHNINRKTVSKWRKRATVEDALMGPKTPRSTVLSPEEEATIVAFRRLTLLPLDDYLYALQPTIPHLRRSSLHCCLQRHGISRLTEIRGEAQAKGLQVLPYRLRPHRHCRGAHGRGQTLSLRCHRPHSAPPGRAGKVCYAELHEKAKRATAVSFLRAVIQAFPYRLHTVLTDNGIQFTHRRRDRQAFRNLFDRVCAEHGMEHRLTKIGHPWTNGQVERMNRTLKEATVKLYYYRSHEQLRQHMLSFLLAYNHAKRLKRLRGLTPYEYICREWQREPDRFVHDPTHDTSGLYT